MSSHQQVRLSHSPKSLFMYNFPYPQTAGDFSLDISRNMFILISKENLYDWKTSVKMKRLKRKFTGAYNCYAFCDRFHCRQTIRACNMKAFQLIMIYLTYKTESQSFYPVFSCLSHIVLQPQLKTQV